MTLVLVLGIGMLIGCAFLLAEVATLPARQRRASIGRVTRYSDAEPLTAGGSGELRERTLEPIFRQLARVVVRLMPRTSLDSIDQRLKAAGLAHRLSASGFLTIKLASSLVGLTFGTLAGISSGSALRGFIAALAFGTAFFVLPERLITGRARGRRERVEADLPDALDLLAISVEAGLSLDGAIAQLIEHMEGPLTEELALTLGEMRIGATRQQALRKLADRVSVPMLTALTRAIIQSDQLGMPLGRILRLQASDARVARQAAAEERANKMPVKMLFPTVIFIFPALFFVILGPAMISVLRVL